MTTLHEIQSPEPSNEPLPMDGELEMNYERLLRNLVQRLESDTYCIPEKTETNIKGLGFGRQGDSTLDISSAKYGNTLARTIEFHGSLNDNQPAFSFTHVQQGDQTNPAWVNSSTEGHCSSRSVLLGLARNWPESDNEFPIDKVGTLILDRSAEPNPEHVFNLLGTYANLHAKPNIRTTSKMWISSKFDSFIAREDTGEQAVSLTTSETNGSQLIVMSILTRGPVEGDDDHHATCYVTCDEIGTITVTTHYIDAETGEEMHPPVADYDKFFDYLVLIVEKMAKVKLAQADRLRQADFERLSNIDGML